MGRQRRQRHGARRAARRHRPRRAASCSTSRSAPASAPGWCPAGRLHRGAQGAAGDIGHVSVLDDDSVLCRCGNTGCLEALAGGLRPRARRAGRALGRPQHRAGARCWRTPATVTARDVTAAAGARRPGEPGAADPLRAPGRPGPRDAGELLQPLAHRHGRAGQRRRGHVPRRAAPHGLRPLHRAGAPATCASRPRRSVTAPACSAPRSWSPTSSSPATASRQWIHERLPRRAARTCRGRRRGLSSSGEAPGDRAGTSVRATPQPLGRHRDHCCRLRPGVHRRPRVVPRRRRAGRAARQRGALLQEQARPRPHGAAGGRGSARRRAGPARAGAARHRPRLAAAAGDRVRGRGRPLVLRLLRVRPRRSTCCGRSSQVASGRSASSSRKAWRSRRSSAPSSSPARSRKLAGTIRGSYFVLKGEL